MEAPMIDASYMKASSNLQGSEALQSGYQERRANYNQDPLSASNTERNTRSYGSVSNK